MKRILLIFAFTLMAGNLAGASDKLAGAFDRTLRLDYVFTGGGSTNDASLAQRSNDASPAQRSDTPSLAQRSVNIALSRMSVSDGWYGRSVNMDSLPVEGNGDIRVVDRQSGETLYANSFSTLFQEWLATDESKHVVKAFENSFLVPMPAAASTVIIRLFDSHRNVICEYSHPLNPDDILIARRGVSQVDRRYVHKAGDPHRCIDVAIVAEGYTAAERDLFYSDAKAAVNAIFAHEPFGRHKGDFNFLAVAPESALSGVSVPRNGIWHQTPVSSNFDTFYIERYLTTDHIFDLHDILCGLPYEHIIILANTEVYGGGGIYNSYTLTTAHHSKFLPVVVHEFGHSFGALADEYDYDSYDDPYYFPTVEPWEQNITTKCDFAAKWKDMIEEGVPGVGLHEGAGYQSKGVWRACPDCRMRTNDATGFCPVCQRAIERIIEFNLRD